MIIEIAETLQKIAMHLSFGLRGFSVPRPGKLSLHGKNGTRSLLTKQQSISISHPLLFPSVNSQVKLDIITMELKNPRGKSYYHIITWTEQRKSSITRLRN